jgi:hypothetical protein
MTHSAACSEALPNGIVEAVRLAVQYEVAGENSYRGSIVKVLDGPAALCEAAPCGKWSIIPPAMIRRLLSYASRDAAQPYVRALEWNPRVPAHLGVRREGRRQLTLGSRLRP